MNFSLKSLFSLGKSKPQQTEPQLSGRVDPLDALARENPDDSWALDAFAAAIDSANAAAKKIQTFEPITRMVGDSAGIVTPALPGYGSGAATSSVIPPALQGWYSSHGFIGYQICAIMAQQWLVNKACTMTGEDAIRNGFDLNFPKGSSDSTDVLVKLRSMDSKFNVNKHCIEFERWKNIFGIRVCLFEVTSDDVNYYEKPFNIDGVTLNSYKGMRQISPLWMFPQLTMRGQSDPTSQNFYEPEYWVIAGKRFHRSHLVITRGPEVDDFLKPSYLFGGVPLTQRIFERVYAAERTANEGPMLALTKRTTALHLDLSAAAMKEKSLTERVRDWLYYRDNHQIRILGRNEDITQNDTSLGDLDSVIMAQYQLVAAIAEVPATKLLGTSPKGFNSSGNFEEASYHEKLESVQAAVMQPLLARHYLLLQKSKFGTTLSIDIAFKPVDTPTAKELAEINLQKVQAGQILADGGTISANEERKRLRLDPHSGYNFIDADDDANVDLEARNTKTGLPVSEQAEIERAKIEKGQASQSVNPGLRPDIKDSNTLHYSGLQPKMPKIKVHGLTVVIENPKGSIRSGMNLDGTCWNSMMPDHYGYISGILGADGDELDAFIGSSAASQTVYVINQNDPSSQQFDEHKVMLNYASEEDAVAAYHAAYSADWTGFGDCVAMSMQQFKDWIKSGDLSCEAKAN